MTKKAIKRVIEELRTRLGHIEAQVDENEFIDAIVSTRGMFNDARTLLENLVVADCSGVSSKVLDAFMRCGRMLGWTDTTTFARFVGLDLKDLAEMWPEEEDAPPEPPKIPKGLAVRRREGRHVRTDSP